MIIAFGEAGREALRHANDLWTTVRIGPDCWVGAKVSVLRGARVGEGSVPAAHTVVRGDVPPRSVVGGIPGRVLKNRDEMYAAEEATRIAIADIARKAAQAARQVDN